LVTLDLSVYCHWCRKFFERAIYEQLSHYFENIFQSFVSAFRPGFGCNTALLKIIEDWKKAIDCNQNTAAVLMDLSKDFDFHLKFLNQWQLPGIYLGLLSSGCGLSMAMYCHQHSYIKYFLQQN
jgi:hypothetical protein